MPAHGSMVGVDAAVSVGAVSVNAAGSPVVHPGVKGHASIAAWLYAMREVSITSSPRLVHDVCGWFHTRSCTMAQGTASFAWHCAGASRVTL